VRHGDEPAAEISSPVVKESEVRITTSCGKLLFEQPWCLGWHWYGYIENGGGRGWGIVDPDDEPYTDMIDMMTSCHQEVVEEARKF
jgi:hypothetical protein